MSAHLSIHKLALGALALLILLLAACTPGFAFIPQPGVEPTRQPVTTPPAEVFSGLDGEDILLQLTYEPGFVMPEYRYPFGRTAYFTLLADGRAIYIDENQDSRVMQVQLSLDEAAALLQKVRDLGFERLESHTDMCGKAADGSETCIADVSTSVLRVRMEDGSLREIQNYANFSIDPSAYDAIFNLLKDYASPAADLYMPHAATLFVRIVPAPEESSPADWSLSPDYVKRALAAPEQFTAVVLSADEAALWQKNVGVDTVTFQLNGQPVMGRFVPWLPGEDFSAQIAAEFPAQ